ncbi:hypothetical protein G6O67_003473 [Ophiocordyceps sinensis]|uniref:Uncharacterized protein n=1 Tax=Ophiocordyceps sinensis TaxID=72228 RepID=A0A8H4V8J5_9HYPO|nr:hypothetical protein G6O67_003473 [Ophiocordyceps sinensis]
MDEAPPPSRSISQIVRLHCRERLLVRPIYWTDRHLELLGCSFGEPSPAPSTVPPVLFGIRGSGHVRRAFAENNYAKVVGRENALDMLLGEDGPCNERPNVRFSFNRRHVQTLKCNVFFPKIQEPDKWPPIVAARLDLTRMELLREALFEPHPHLAEAIEQCESARALAYAKLQKITPKKPRHDPYIVAILIAIAQENSERVALNNEPSLSLLTSQVLVTLSDIKTHDIKELHVYKASITSSFLRSLDDPSFVPSEPLSIPINITTVRYAPFRTFLDRLTPLVLPEIDLARLRDMKGDYDAPPSIVKDHEGTQTSRDMKSRMKHTRRKGKRKTGQ